MIVLNILCIAGESHVIITNSHLIYSILNGSHQNGILMSLACSLQCLFTTFTFDTLLYTILAAVPCYVMQFISVQLRYFYIFV